jgi:hypothetical protein
VPTQRPYTLHIHWHIAISRDTATYRPLIQWFTDQILRKIGTQVLGLGNKNTYIAVVHQSSGRLALDSLSCEVTRGGGRWPDGGRQQWRRAPKTVSPSRQWTEGGVGAQWGETEDRGVWSVAGSWLGFEGDDRWGVGVSGRRRGLKSQGDDGELRDELMRTLKPRSRRWLSFDYDNIKLWVVRVPGIVTRITQYKFG